MKDKIKEEKVLNLYYEGLNDNQIGKIVNCSTESVRNVRLKYKLKSNFNYSQRWVVDEILLEDLVKKGLHDKEISNKLKVSEKSVSEARKRYGIKRPAYNIAKKIIPTKFQLSVLLGTLLGDSSLVKKSDSINYRFTCEHGDKQNEYCYSKFKILESLDLTFRKIQRKSPDRRNGIFYKSSLIQSKSNTYLTELAKSLYKNDVKGIYEEFLENFDEISLAYMFMDDGSKTSSGSIILCTNCFTKNDLDTFNNFCRKRFDFYFTIYKNHSLYLPKRFYPKFKSLILPYIHPSLMYKIS